MTYGNRSTTDAGRFAAFRRGGSREAASCPAKAHEQLRGSAPGSAAAHLHSLATSLLAFHWLQAQWLAAAPLVALSRALSRTRRRELGAAAEASGADERAPHDESEASLGGTSDTDTMGMVRLGATGASRGAVAV